MVHKCPKCSHIICATNHLGESNVKLVLKTTDADKFWVCPDCSHEVKVITRTFSDNTEQYIFDIKQTVFDDGDGDDDKNMPKPPAPKKKICPNCNTSINDYLIRCNCGYSYDLDAVIPIGKPSESRVDAPEKKRTEKETKSKKKPKIKREKKPKNQVSKPLQIFLLVLILITAGVVIYSPSFRLSTFRKSHAGIKTLLAHKAAKLKARAAKQAALPPDAKEVASKPAADAGTDKTATLQAKKKPAPKPKKAATAVTKVTPPSKAKPALQTKTTAPAPRPISVKPKPVAKEPVPTTPDTVIITEETTVKKSAVLPAVPSPAPTPAPAPKPKPAPVKLSPAELKFGPKPLRSSLDGSYVPVKSHLAKLSTTANSYKLMSCTNVYSTDNGWLVQCKYKTSATEDSTLTSKWFLIRQNKVVRMY